jgi:hypothetical protein
MTEKMDRFQVFLEHRQIEALESLATEQHKSIAQVIREIIDSCLEKESEVKAKRQKIWLEELRFMQDWMAQASGTNERTWKREDAYDR